MKRSLGLLAVFFPVSVTTPHKPDLTFWHLMGQHRLTKTHVISITQDQKGRTSAGKKSVYNHGTEVTCFIRKSVNMHSIIVAKNTDALAGNQIDDYIRKPVNLEWLVNTPEKWGSHLRIKRLVS